MFSYEVGSFEAHIAHVYTYTTKTIYWLYFSPKKTLSLKFAYDFSGVSSWSSWKSWYCHHIHCNSFLQMSMLGLGILGGGGRRGKYRPGFSFLQMMIMLMILVMTMMILIPMMMMMMTMIRSSSPAADRRVIPLPSSQVVWLIYHTKIILVIYYILYYIIFDWTTTLRLYQN